MRPQRRQPPPAALQRHRPRARPARPARATAQPNERWRAKVTTRIPERSRATAASNAVLPEPEGPTTTMFSRQRAAMRSRSAIRRSRSAAAISLSKVAWPGRRGAGPVPDRPARPAERRPAPRCRRAAGMRPRGRPTRHETAGKLLQMRLIAEPVRRRRQRTVALDVDGRRPVHEHRVDRSVGPDQIEGPQAAEFAQSQPRQPGAPGGPALEELVERRVDGVDGGLAGRRARAARESRARALAVTCAEQRRFRIARRPADQRRRRTCESGVGYDRRRPVGLVSRPRRFRARRGRS